MEDQIRSEVLKTIPYGFYATGVIGADGEALCKDRAVVKRCHRELAEIHTNLLQAEELIVRLEPAH